MPLSGSLIIFWNGTDADIPVGWSRKAELDGYYLKGIETSGCNPGTIGGGAHTHTSGSHNHTQAAHTHGASSSTEGGVWSETSAGADLSGPHSHTTTIGNTTATNVQNNGLTIASSISQPSFTTLIAVNPSTAEGIPLNGIVYYINEDMPTGFKICDGNNGTPNLLSKFIKIPDAGHSAGELGGGTHTHSTTSHTHAQNQHRHTINLSSKTADKADAGTGAEGGADSPHGHATANTEYKTAVNSSSTVSMSSETLEPPYNTLIAVQNQESESLPTGIICMFIGLLEDIPVGWVLCDGTNSTPDLTDKFVKTAITTAGVGVTGGSIVHSHTANTHTHGTTSHNHTGTSGKADASSISNYVYGPTLELVSGDHTHDITISNSSQTNYSATVIINDSTADTRPPFYEVAYIQYQTASSKQSAQAIIIM